jgi:hypothetical protein
MVLAGAILSVGCGDGDGGKTGGDGGGGGSGATCSSNASCGGDIVGTWTIAQACYATLSRPLSCAQEQQSVSDQVQTGTMVFGSDGTFMLMTRTTGTLSILLPPSCLAEQAATCAEADANLRELAEISETFTSASCVDDAGTCACALMFDISSNGSGTYTTAGSTLTITSSGDPRDSTYCVAGSTLVMAVEAGSTADPPRISVLTRP